MFVSTLMLALAACSRTPGGVDADGDAPTVLGPADVAKVEQRSIASGPRLSGTLEPVQKAVIRAEAGGSVLEVNVELGDTVSVGQVLGKIETSGTGDVWRSAQASVLAAEQDLRVADKDLERARRLAEAGALSPHDLELAESQRLSAEARLGGARAQLSSAGSQLGRTTLKSPLAGVVSERAARVGDVVSPGSPMFTVIEPSSLRLEASVPASAVSMVQVGAAVEFEVQGYPGRTIEGTIDRVSPAVDPVTRQIPVLVTVPNAGHALVAGLFADGRIANDLHQGLVVPLSAIDETGAVPVVLQVREGTVVRTEVELGTHDDATESVEVVRGLAAGDVVILGSAGDVEPGAHVSLQAAAGEG